MKRRFIDLVVWGKHKENGIWIASRSQFKMLFWHHDALYVGFWRLRLRLMKPWRAPCLY